MSVGATVQIRGALADVKPRLRGWLHLGTIPLTIAAGAVLVALSPTASTRVGSSVFIGSALALFTVSAAYHRGAWSPRTGVLLRRLDHANIFLLIAGSYTAYSLILLEGEPQAVLLWIVWSGAFLGVLFRVCWINAPRWLHTPVYIALGAAALPFIPDLVRGAAELRPGIGAATLLMLAAGAALYTLGGLVYGIQKPDPWPTWFGFHEVFHSLTVLAFAAHLTGVGLATISLR